MAALPLTANCAQEDTTVRLMEVFLCIFPAIHPISALLEASFRYLAMLDTIVPQSHRAQSAALHHFIAQRYVMHPSFALLVIIVLRFFVPVIHHRAPKVEQLHRIFVRLVLGIDIMEQVALVRRSRLAVFLVRQESMATTLIAAFVLTARQVLFA